MRLLPSIINHAEKALQKILFFTGPADNILSSYFREHHQLGSHDRNVIAKAIYNCLRNKAAYTFFSESSGSGPTARRMILLGLNNITNVESLGGLSKIEIDWLMKFSKNDDQVTDLIRSNLPKWIFDRLLACYGKVNVLLLSHALNRSAPIDLRINLLKTNRQEVITALAKLSIICEKTPYSKLGLRIIKKSSLQNLLLFKDGRVELQDEGSQLLAQIVGAKRGEVVVDFCAGTGGKTLALGADMHGTGKLYAFDISQKRLTRLKLRVKRSGLTNVYPILIEHESDYKIKRLIGKIDRVLVDVPCSGLGTLRRNPGTQWRQTQEAVAEMSIKQIAILSSAAQLVRPGGCLVYGTCSILHEENSAIVRQFLASHGDFSLTPMKEIIVKQRIRLKMESYLELWPHLHQTDGFFAALFIRK